MKSAKHIAGFILMVSLLFSAACKVKKKDCRGKRKTVKTDMGGWL